MKETYTAQGGNLFCNNPMTDTEPVKIAVCCKVDNMPGSEVAEKLADRLNQMSNLKDLATQKDDILNDAVSYLLSVDSKEVPGALRHAVLKAYEV